MGKKTHTTIPLRKMCGSEYERPNSQMNIQYRRILSFACHESLHHHRWICLPGRRFSKMRNPRSHSSILFLGDLYLCCRSGSSPEPPLHRQTASCYPRFCVYARCQAAIAAQDAWSCIFLVAYHYRSKITIPTIMKQTDKLF